VRRSMRTDSTTRRVRAELGAGRSYDIEIGPRALDSLGMSALRVLSPRVRRVALVSNRRVFALYGERAVASLRAAGFEVSHWLMGDGERFKTWATAGRALEFLAETGLERTDAVVALGGGVVGDVAGFAAAAYMRGVAFMQAPTTLLAQIDSSVGGKTGVNLREGKNLAGAFHQPRAVVADTSTLRTLPLRELTAGWCEAIKHGAAGDSRLFERTVSFLSEERERRPSRQVRRGRRTTRESRRDAEESDSEFEEGEGRLAELVAAHCAYKARVVAGDEREDAERTDAGSRRVLNFGHTVGHALETATGYRRFRHGEAVGYGMLAAGEISKRLGLLGASELESLREAVRLAGHLPRADDLDAEAVRRAIARDKKSSGGHVRWVLLEGLGRARIVDGPEVAARVVRDAIRAAIATRRPPKIPEGTRSK
jgi:3-dehydroquinate synthase